jgi:hypothetical protein
VLKDRTEVNAKADEEKTGEEDIHQDGEIFIGPPLPDNILEGLFLDLGDDPCSPPK